MSTLGLKRYAPTRCHETAVLGSGGYPQAGMFAVKLSARPELVVDGQRALRDPAWAQIGIPGPLGRQRIVSALPTNKAGGPVQISGDVLLHLGDADGNVIGQPQRVWVHRLLYARWTEDTRRLAG